MAEIETSKRAWTAIELRLLTLFLGLLVVFSAAIQTAIIAFGAKYMWLSALAWMPAAAAILAIKITKTDANIIGWTWGARRWRLLGWATPILYMVLAALILIFAGLAWFDLSAYGQNVGKHLGIGGWSHQSILLLSLPWIVTIGVIKSLVNTLGEEIGWRGLLVPILYRRFGFIATGLISGIIWVLWYSPIIVWGGYYSPAAAPSQTILPLIFFAVATMSLAFPLAYLRLRSASLWPPALFHAAHNSILLGLMGWYFTAKRHTDIELDGFGSVSPSGEFGYVLAGISLTVAACYCGLAYRDGMITKSKGM